MPVYKDTTRCTWYYKGSYIDAFGNRKYYMSRGYKTKKLAQQAEREYLLLAKQNRKEKIKVNDLFIQFINYKSDRVKPRTIYTYNHLYKKQLKDKFGLMYVDKITIPMLEQWQQEILNCDYRNEYIISIQTLLKAILRFAVRKMYIDQNPLDYLDYVKRTNEPKPKMNFFTLDDYKRFRSAISKEIHIVLFDMLYWTGMRLGELQARTWRDLDFKTGDLNIHSNWDNKNRQITNSTKNGEERIIYIPKDVLEELSELYNYFKHFDGFNEDWYIFGGIHPIPCKTIENAKNRYIDNYNDTHTEKLPKIRTHDFRHSHVSYLANNGADAWDIAERLGHSRDMVIKRYSHMFPEKRNKMKKLLE